MTELSHELLQAVEILRCAHVDGRQGLPEKLFLLVSSVVPLPNVDLLITDKAGRLLLARRNDGFFENSWHIPGGCMRYGETLEHCLQRTARREIGCEVLHEEAPVAVRSVFRGPNPDLLHPNERGHNIAILYRCALPDSFLPDNGKLNESDAGYLKWFHTLPQDFMSIQHVYDDVLTPWTGDQR
ncbi:NUDIX domain-containing protein [uncultured Mailhella sp.]|uniref:NUDIX hydrolase n=1 Tax=uncultured Mailhella sp. TaxID=1981031 RepID=UPI0026017B3C|nr:NUDIX domain-containing protein [uncultured Mailhella sp.]